ncbi:unnamed protein product [Schistosoma curassoni]|uniref:Endo/exonuclease/phosphatase domain-containing protein n=1 Tax=Schistosoma curassoni TaxID=6186 RepID=A0A183KB51_9TREM|nr:unnamed protein product [Schistosoma curassoni]
MTPHDESRIPTEVTRPMPLLTTTATIYLSTWNVRTMWDTGRAFQIAVEMRRYNLEVLEISETHWTQVEQQRLTSRELLLYSGHEEENAPHTQGIALMLSKQAQNALIGWESHEPRIIKASFKTKKEGISMNIIQCYAPINDYNENFKDQFYDRLQSIDTDKLNKFKIALNNKFKTFHDLLNEEGTTMESNWKGIKEAITSTCDEILGHKKHHHKEWITVDTLDKIQERRNKKAAINASRTRAEKAKAQAEYTEINKQVKRSIRTDKRKYVEDLAMTVKRLQEKET